MGQEFLKGRVVQDVVHHSLYGAPEGADGAIEGVRADVLDSGVILAEGGLEEPSPQKRQDFPHSDFPGRPR